MGAVAAFPLAGSAQSLLGRQLLASGQATFQRDGRAPDRGTWIILPGTRGGPTPSTYRGQDASVLLVEGRSYVVDAGSGVALNLQIAGIDLAKLQNVFITHHHSDHDIDMGNLVLRAWGTNKRDRFDLYGPAPIQRMVADFLRMSRVDIDIRQDEAGRPELAPLVHAHEVPADGGPVMSDDWVQVTCVSVPHFRIPTCACRAFLFKGLRARGPADRPPGREQRTGGTPRPDRRPAGQPRRTGRGRRVAAGRRLPARHQGPGGAGQGGGHRRAGEVARPRDRTSGFPFSCCSTPTRRQAAVA